MTKPATGIGQSQRVIGASCQTATRKTASETAQNSDDLDDRQLPARQLAAGGARVARVEPRVDQPVQRHRQRPRADHRDRDPDEVVPARPRVHGEERADVRERQREHGVLDLHEPREARRQRREGDFAHPGGTVAGSQRASSSLPCSVRQARNASIPRTPPSITAR